MEHARPPAEFNMEGGPVGRADGWKRWRQQFMVFLNASGVYKEPTKIQASLLINLIGPQGFDIYQTFQFENEAERSDITLVLKKFDNYFGTKTNTTLVRYKFFTRNQEEGESIIQHVTALRLISKNCEFSTLEDDLIKDRIVCGVLSTSTRNRLLRADNLDLDLAIKLCQADEITLESEQQIEGSIGQANNIHIDEIQRRWMRGMRAATRTRGRDERRAPALSRSGASSAVTSWRADRALAEPARQPRCNGCGNVRCEWAVCPARNITCFVCGNRGHFARMCKLNRAPVQDRDKTSSLIVATKCSDDLIFPPGFKFGAATASYQVEGAWNVSDKSENIWDRFVHENPSAISDRSNGDVACDSYHLWERDIEIASELGIHFYRFSISWTRLMPNSFTNKVSEDGKNYYNKLIDGLLAKGIEPVVTLYHWDLPQRLQDLGGWTNPLIADWFTDYARVAYSLYADRVKTWLTINEPLVVCDAVYNTGIIAPGIVDPEVATYICNKNILLAHAKAWRVYDEEFKHKYHGKVSIANHLMWMEAYSNEEKDLTELALENMAGRYSHPIYSKDGDWPPVIKKMAAENSKKQGYSKSNLPAFTKEEIELIKGTSDFYAMNHYTSRVVRKAKPDEELIGWPIRDMPEINARLEKHPDWKQPKAGWFLVNPLGFRRQLVWLKKQYGDMEFLITENGFPTEGSLDDQERIDFYKSYLKQLLLAIEVDGVNVTGYTAWTLLDNFEWMDGYKTKFGLYEVDFNSPERTRTPRASAHFYKELIRKNSQREIFDEL